MKTPSKRKGRGPVCSICWRPINRVRTFVDGVRRYVMVERELFDGITAAAEDLPLYIDRNHLGWVLSNSPLPTERGHPPHYCKSVPVLPNINSTDETSEGT